MSLTRIGSIGINTGIAFAGVTTIVTLNTANDALSIGATVNVGSGITLGASGDIFATGVSTVTTLKVGSGVTVSSDGDVFATGVTTSTTFSGAFSGSGANITALNASNLASGTVPTARLGSGTASSSTFLRGDSSFQTITTDLVGDTTPQLGGNLDVNTKNILFGDSGGATDDRLTFGAGTDLSIYHDGSHSRIVDSGTGNLILQTSKININNADGTEAIIHGTAGGAVEVYHANSAKLTTSASGVTVTGTVTADGLVLSDSDEIQFGNSTDFRIYHDSNNSYIRDVGTGSLSISGSQVSLDSSNLAEYMVRAIENGAVELYHDGGLRLSTESSQVTIHRPTAFPNPNNTGAEITGATLDIGGNLHLEERYPAGAYADRQDLVLKTNTGYGQGLADKVRFSSSGSIFLEVSGAGISFEPHGASNVNLLDDYEEGTYTPTDASGAGLSLTTNTTAAYTKIGRMMYIQFDITWPSNSNTTDASITMPTGLGLSVSYGSGVVGWTDNGNPLFIHVGSRVYIMDNNNALGNSSQHAKNNEISGKRLIGSFWYISS